MKFSDPQYILLAEIVFNNAATADSAFALLERGADFSEIVQKYSIAPSRSNNGSLGVVNVQIFPQQIKTILLKLKTGTHTAPLKQGEQFTIYKHLKK